MEPEEFCDVLSKIPHKCRMPHSDYEEKLRAWGKETELDCSCNHCHSYQGHQYRIVNGIFVRTNNGLLECLCECKLHYGIFCSTCHRRSLEECICPRLSEINATASCFHHRINPYKTVHGSNLECIIVSADLNRFDLKCSHSGKAGKFALKCKCKDYVLAVVCGS